MTTIIRPSLRLATALFVTFFLIRSAGAADESCTSAFDSSSIRSINNTKIDAARKSWEVLAEYNPNQFNPKDFIYLIAAYEDADWSSVESIRNLIRQRTEDRATIAMSVIGPGHIITFLNQEKGFILSVPPANLFASLPTDMGPISAEMSPTDIQASFPLAKPKDVLRSTIGIWNEVRGFTSTGTGQVKVTGLFYIRTLPAVEIQEMQTIAQFLNLPLVGLTP